MHNTEENANCWISNPTMLLKKLKLVSPQIWEHPMFPGRQIFFAFLHFHLWKHFLC